MPHRVYIRHVLIDNTSSPWHDGYQVLGQIEDGVAGVSYFILIGSTTYMLTSKT